MSADKIIYTFQYKEKGKWIDYEYTTDDELEVVKQTLKHFKRIYYQCKWRLVKQKTINMVIA